MGTIAVKIKIMPSSPDTDLKKLTTNAKKLIESSGGKNSSFSEEPIAFGLKAIIAFFAWPEDKEIEKLETGLAKIKDVNSIQIIDMRRAF